METPEQLVFRPRFAAIEKERLLADGAWIYLSRGLTLEQQEAAQREKGQPAFSYLVKVAEGLLTLPSRPIEMAIYPDPRRFFIEGSFNKNIAIQERLVADEARLLRARLELSGITKIIPREAANLTDITFQHFNRTDVWLFGPEYAAVWDEEWVYSRTKDPTDRSEGGTWYAYVGGVSHRLSGLKVRDWSAGGIPFVGVIHLVVPVAQVNQVPEVEREKMLVAA